MHRGRTTVRAEHDGDLGFHPRLDQCSRNAAVRDEHGVQQRSVVRLVDPHLLAHHLRGVAELRTDTPGSPGEAHCGEFALNRVCGLEVEGDLGRCLEQPSLAMGSVDRGGEPMGHQETH